VSPASFLLFALGVSVVGSVVLWLRHRRPVGVGATIDAFRRELDALSPRDLQRPVGESAPVEPGDAEPGTAVLDDVGGAGFTYDQSDGPLLGDDDVIDEDDQSDGYLRDLYRHDDEGL